VAPFHGDRGGHAARGRASAAPQVGLTCSFFHGHACEPVKDARERYQEWNPEPLVAMREALFPLSGRACGVRCARAVSHREHADAAARRGARHARPDSRRGRAGAPREEGFTLVLYTALTPEIEMAASDARSEEAGSADYRMVPPPPPAVSWEHGEARATGRAVHRIVSPSGFASRAKLVIRREASSWSGASRMTAIRLWPPRRPRGSS